MSLGALDEIFFFGWVSLVGFVLALRTMLMIKMSSVLPLPRCPSGNASPNDRQHYRDGGRAGCSLHGNEVHHLWGRRQNKKVSHRHDWRHRHPDRRSDIYIYIFFLLIFSMDCV